MSFVASLMFCLLNILQNFPKIGFSDSTSVLYGAFFVCYYVFFVLFSIASLIASISAAVLSNLTV